jgi:hypothetical protein
MNREVRSLSSSFVLKHLDVSINHVQHPRILFDDFQCVMHHLDLRIILLLDTNGALEPHDPRSSLPERDVHGFVFTVVAAATLTVTVTALTVIATQVIVIATLAVAVAVILQERDKSVLGMLTIKLTSIDRWDRTTSGPIFH